MGKWSKATPHKERLANLHAICLQISRHILQKMLVNTLSIHEHFCFI